MFDRDLFLTLCEEYGVEFSDTYTKPMYREDDGTMKELIAERKRK